MSKLNFFKIKEFIKEFPFLSEVPNLLSYKELELDEVWDFCELIRVHRVTKELLEITPRMYPDGYEEARNIHHMVVSELYYIVDIDNNIYKVRHEYDDGLLGEPDTPIEMYGERIIECIGRLMFKDERIGDKIRYIFNIHNGYRPPVADDAEKYFRIAIYKAAKGDSISELIEERLNEAKNIVKAECNF